LILGKILKLPRTSIYALRFYSTERDSFTFKFVYGLFSDALSHTQYIALTL